MVPVPEAVSISSSPAICLLLGLEAGFALELTVLSSLAAPFIGPMVTKLLLGEAVPLRFHEYQRKGLLSRMFGGARR